MNTLEDYLDGIRRASTGVSDEALAERIRYAEILWYHAEAGWVDRRFLTRAANLICHPETWEDWKARGGDGEEPMEE